MWNGLKVTASKSFFISFKWKCLRIGPVNSFIFTFCCFKNAHDILFNAIKRRNNMNGFPVCKVVYMVLLVCRCLRCSWIAQINLTKIIWTAQSTDWETAMEIYGQRILFIKHKFIAFRLLHLGNYFITRIFMVSAKISYLSANNSI